MFYAKNCDLQYFKMSKQIRWIHYTANYKQIISTLVNLRHYTLFKLKSYYFEMIIFPVCTKWYKINYETKTLIFYITKLIQHLE